MEITTETVQVNKQENKFFFDALQFDRLIFFPYCFLFCFF